MRLIVAPLVAISLSSSAAPQPEKEFKFEVLSIHPAQSGGLMGGSVSPNGYTARVTLWQAIAIAYAPGGWDPRTWTSVKITNNPGWLADTYRFDARVAQADLKAWQNQSTDRELLR